MWTVKQVFLYLHDYLILKLSFNQTPFSPPTCDFLTGYMNCALKGPSRLAFQQFLFLKASHKWEKGGRRGATQKEKRR